MREKWRLPLRPIRESSSSSASPVVRWDAVCTCRASSSHGFVFLQICSSGSGFGQVCGKGSHLTFQCLSPLHHKLQIHFGENKTREMDLYTERFISKKIKVSIYRATDKAFSGLSKSKVFPEYGPLFQKYNYQFGTKVHELSDTQRCSLEVGKDLRCFSEGAFLLKGSIFMCTKN